MIVICIPYYDKIDPRTLECANAIGGELRTRRDTYIGKSRNMMIHNETSSRRWQTLPKEIEGYLFLDSGNTLTKEQFEKMKGYDVDIISAAYHPRGNNDCWCAGYAKFEKDLITKDYLPSTMTGMVDDIDIVGAGALYVKRKVFEELEYPWFRHEWVRFTKNDVEYQCQTGEDFGFCLLAKGAGYKIHIDCDIVSQHYHKE